MRQFLALMFLTMLSIGVRAEVSLDGYFIAQQVCPAFQSFNNQTNPGGIMTTPERAYRIVAANKAEASHYLVLVPGVQPERRWVAITCGVRTVDAEGQVPTGPTEPTAPTGPQPATQTQFILAVSWQPAFCEGHDDKPECESQTEDRFDASHFTLHGLWPQPRSNVFCNVPADQAEASDDGRWNDLPPLELSAGLRTELDQVMPGTQSGLERHEWTKHGTCYDTDAEEYYADSLAMMAALNGSAVRELFAGNVGAELTQEQIRGAFDAAFGPGAGERVRIACNRDGNRQLIGELTIGLTGTIATQDDFAALIGAASSTSGGCNAGVVDPVGLQ
jgi:ribonuclease T2